MLMPFSLLYGIIALIRNKFFDWGIIPSRSFGIPVISVGNLSVGGTGKTPHVEYLIRLLNKEFGVATLSRGYKRKTSGFILAGPGSSHQEIGDEPLQYAQKFDSIRVAVDENRAAGIAELQQRFSELDVILLDDAFQHRKVKPGRSILTTDFHNLYTDDFPLPSGTLREFRCGAKRADIIIVTKTPNVLSPITRRRITKELKPRVHQHLFFTYIRYGKITPLCEEHKDVVRDKYSSILMFSGIANSYPLVEHLKTMCNDLSALEFRDHHMYSLKDLEQIGRKFDDIFTKNKVIITTEKDAMRLKKKSEFQEILKKLAICYIPIEIHFHNGDNLIFDDLILEYVKETLANRSVPPEQE